VPKDEYEATRYVSTAGWDGIQPTAIKNAICTATVLTDGLTKASVRRSVYIEGAGYSDCEIRHELVKLDYDERRMREDIVRLAGPSRTPDMRWRAEYLEWSAEFTMRYNRHIISTEQLLHLIVLAGESIGLYEGRPERSALAWGRFQLDMNSTVREVA